MKGTYTEELLKKLNAIGVPAIRGQEADIEIETTFTDAKWTAGNKIIKYASLISFDEDKKTIFMYEKTSESGSGLSFGGGMESSFQSGKTLFRKVKSTMYGIDGKAYEVDLDLGLIPKTVKTYAQQMGWKFKTVLSAKKAHSTGIVVPIAAAGMAAVAPDITSAAEPTPQQPTNPVHQTQETNAKVSNKASQYRPKRKAGLLGLIIWGITLLFVLGLMWLSHTSIIGIGLALVLVIAGYFIQSHKAWFMSILIWVGVLILLFGVYIFTTDLNASQDFGSPSSAIDYENAEYSVEIYNLGVDASYYIGATDLSDYANNKIIHELKLIANVFQDITINGLEGDERVVEVILTDFEWVQEPKLGTLANLSWMPGLNDEFNPRVDAYTIIYDTDAFSQQNSGWSNSLCFQFELVELGTYQYPDGFSGTSSYVISAQNLGIRAEDLSFSFRYSIIAKTANGKEYISQTTVEAIEGDFLYGSVSPMVSARVFNYMDGKQFANYK